MMKCKSKKQRLKEQKEAIAAGIIPERLLCRDCGLEKPVSEWGINRKNGKPLFCCPPCHKKMCDSKAAYNKTDSRKAASKRWRESDVGKETKKRYDNSQKGKDCSKRYRVSNKGIEARKRYSHSDVGKARRSRYEEGEAGKARTVRFRSNVVDRRQNSSAMRKDLQLMSASNSLISGRYQQSPTFIARTSFVSEADFLSHLKLCCSNAGVEWNDHGAIWNVEHKIPRVAYDFDNPADVKRCWSKKNVSVATAVDNHSKWVYLDDKVLLEIGIDNFPIAWNGEIPTTEFKQAFYERVRAGQAYAL